MNKLVLQLLVGSALAASQILNVEEKEHFLQKEGPMLVTDENEVSPALVKENDSSNDITKTFFEIVEENGFISSSHQVTTEDGYKLNMFRIKSPQTQKGAPVMFLQHGILDSADCWIMNFPSLAPAFVLAAEGYDVWLGNSRGSRYSMEHEYLDPKKDKEFWEFSFTEMGEYDAPAQFEYALKISEQKKATFIAHSQGTSQMFYALSAHPHYWKDKINLFVALAPVALMTHSRDLLFTFASNNLELFKFASNTAHVYSILEPGLPTAVTKIFCSFAGPICNLLQVFVTSHNPDLDDLDRFKVYMGHYPSGASIQSLMHYGQVITSPTGDMPLYNWGTEALNYKHYNQTTPPNVEFSKISVHTAMFVGGDDPLADVTDATLTQQKMNPHYVKHFEVVNGGHLTFMVGKEASYMDKVKSLIKEQLA